MRLTVPWGIFGSGNIGDEAMLNGFAVLVKAYPRRLSVRIASENPAHAAAAEPAFQYYSQNSEGLKKWRATWRSRGQLIVGDTPIMDHFDGWPLEELSRFVDAANQERKPIVFLGTGTETLQHESSKRIVKECLGPAVVHWSVRSARDSARLQEYGVDPARIKVAADLAWLLEASGKEFGQGQFQQLGLKSSGVLIGVSFTREAFVHQQSAALPARLAHVLDALVEEYDARIVFFCNEVRSGAEFDHAANEEIRALMVHRAATYSVRNNYWTPAQMLSLIGNCDYTIGMRYHFCLFSALQGIPFVAIKRSDKVDDLCWQLDWPHAVSLDDVTPTHVRKVFSAMQAGRKQLGAALEAGTQQMREKARLNSAALDAICSASARVGREPATACRTFVSAVKWNVQDFGTRIKARLPLPIRSALRAGKSWLKGSRRES
jgi:polysaccharide pyruvyl transferase WcaK-like protein